MRRVYKNKQYIVFRSDDCGYILVNILMPGFAHTHIESLETCRKLISYSLHKKIPRHLSNYLLESLLRVNNDKEYCEKIQNYLKNRRYTDKYYNVNNGVKNK